MMAAGLRMTSSWVRLLVGARFLIGLVCLGSAPALAVSFDQGLLFEVRTGGGASSYLFGTIHSSDPRVIELPSSVRDAFAGASAFAMEAVPDTSAILQSMVTMVYADGRTLEGVVGKRLFRETVEAMAERGMSESAIKDFKPWAIVTLLSLPPDESGQFMDMRLYEQALAAGKPVVGLETMDEQLAVFDGLSEADQVALLRDTLEQLDRLPEVFDELVTAYQRRDLEELLRLSDDHLNARDTGLAERFKSAALGVRNPRMVERMRPLLDKGDYFIAVGALHLPGEGGILHRLVEAGLKVRPVY